VIRSYAQQAEDVRLARAFGQRSTGFYIDVGACHPVFDSVTKHFYDQGWSGIDIEPGTEAADLLRKDRPRDIVLEMACSDQEGEAILYESEEAGWSTLSPDVAADTTDRRGTSAAPRTTPTRTLTSICAEHVHGPIDFLKVDVEGHEAAVLRGADFDRWRPAIVVVEATVPHTTIPSYAGWEPVLLGAGYEPAAFDGINRFYVAREHADLARLIEPPITVLDGWETHRYLWALEHADNLEHELADARQRRDEEHRLRVAAEARLQYRREGSLAAPRPVVRAVRSLSRLIRVQAAKK
jgi:FkbM family methyltransferase